MGPLDMKIVSGSAIEYYPYQIFPDDLNAYETAFGGRILEIADRLAGVVAQRHSSQVCVTLSMDTAQFLAPARRGDTLVFKAAVNRVWNTSMEIGVKVFAHNLHTDEMRHVFSTYFTFVAVDAVGKPQQICPIMPETEEEKRRFAEAGIRRAYRLRLKEELKQPKNQ